MLRKLFKQPSKRYKIFLSHSGHDAKRAIKLGKSLKKEMNRYGYSVEVFNTSEPENRFRDLKEVIMPGDDWVWRTGKYEDDLRAYLRENLLSSDGYILLVTKRSLQANSPWVNYEIEMAHAETIKQSHFYFIPCVTDGARLGDLPEKARMFNGIELEHGGIFQLAKAFEQLFQRRSQIPR